MCRLTSWIASLNIAIEEQTRELKGVDTGDGHCPKGSLPKVKKVEPVGGFRTVTTWRGSGEVPSRTLAKKWCNLEEDILLHLAASQCPTCELKSSQVNKTQTVSQQSCCLSRCQDKRRRAGGAEFRFC